MTIFSPAGDCATVTLNGTTSARAALSPPTTNQSFAYAVTNGDSGFAFVRFGDSAVDAAATDFPVAPGATLALDVGPSATHFAAVAPSSATGSVFATPIYTQTGR